MCGKGEQVARPSLPVACVLLLAAALLPRAGGAATGLVAHYTFDEGSGTVLKDHSGNGNDGQIHGATWVKSPRGRALRFDGKDDYVSLGRKPSLQIAGDMTIEAWVKTHYQDCPARGKLKRHRLILGTNASLSIQRNYNLRINHRDQFWLEWADNARYGAAECDASFLDGTWKHITVVLEAGRYCYVFVDGKLLHRQPAGGPAPRPTPFDIHIGGWFAGCFKGDIDEIRLYNRAISTREIWRSAGIAPARQAPLFEMRAGYSYHQKAFPVHLVCMAPRQDSPAVSLRVLDPAGKALVDGKRLALAGETRPGSGRWVWDAQVEAKGVRPGDYRLEATLVDQQGRALARATAKVPCTTPPEWLGSRIGITDKVLPPYTPCEVSKGAAGCRVRTWGRRHDFAAAPFLSGIESARSQLLAGPVRFVATANGERLHWSPRAPDLRGESPAEVRLNQTLPAKGASLTIATRLDYDGFMKVDWAIEAERPVTIERLAVEFPLSPQIARLLYCWPTTHSGALKTDWASDFRPILWIGDEERGLCWVAECDRNWLLADRFKAIEVVRGSKEVTLRLNLVTRKTELKAGQKLDYSFGLQATPVRPATTTCWQARIERQPPYAHEYKWLTKKIEGRPALQFYSEQGAGALLVWRWWDAFSYTLPLGHEKQFPKLVAAAHRHNLKIVPYTIGFLLSEAAPEFKHFSDDMLVHPRRPFVIDRLPGLDVQTTYYACVRGAWQDFCVASTARCMDDYDIDGVYLDTTVRPHACRNRLHGCGYLRPDGTVGETYPVFATRQLMKRLYTVVKSRKPDGIVDAHVYDCINVPALAFATSYWNGEQLSHREFKPDKLPLDRFRTEFMGHNLGIAADLLYYKLGDYDACVALALIHDVPVRSENEKDFAILTTIWRVREAFGCKDAEFVGYWKAGPLVTVEPKGCRASLWRHPKNGVLAAVANLSRQQADVRMGLDLRKLGLGGRSSAEDARSKRALPVKGNEVSLSLPSQGWMLVWLRAEKQP